MLVWQLLTALTLVANGYSENLETRIIGGHDAKIEDYPYQVSIQGPAGHWCGGSIISSRYVLTAGRCVALAYANLTVRAGSAFHSKGGSIHQVDWSILHEKWNQDGDIAIVRVKEPFVFDETRQPIKLFKSNESEIGGTFSNITGWGLTSESIPKVPDQLQAVSTRLVSWYLCRLIYDKTPRGAVTKGQICAGRLGTGGQGDCYGDQGGPLVVRGRQYGISTGQLMGCGSTNYPGIFTNVAHFKKWIDQHVIV